MGKSRRKGARGRKNKSKDLLAGKKAAVKGARHSTTLALVQRLDSADVEERLQACITLANMFGDKSVVEKAEEDGGMDEDMEEESAVDAGTETARRNYQEEILDTLVKKNAFKVLVNRVCDADPQVRLHACGALCNITNTWAPISGKLAKDGIHIPLITLVQQFAQTKDGADEIVEAATHALFLLAEMAKSSQEVVNAACQAPFLQALCELVSNSNNGSVSENAARLLHILSDGNRAFAATFLSSPAAVSILEKHCSQKELVASAPAIALHCIGTLQTVSILGMKPEALDPAKVCQHMLEVCSFLWQGSGSGDVQGQLQAQSLALEVLTNSCSTAMVEDSDEQVSAEQELFEAQSIQGVADMIAKSTFVQVVPGVLEECERSISSSQAQALGPRACGLLDNIVQNASVDVVQSFNLQQVWHRVYNLLSAIVSLLSETGDEVETFRTDSEEFVQFLTALMWSIVRRAVDSPERSLLTLPEGHLFGLLEAARVDVQPHVRANIVGMLGSIGCMRDKTGEEDLKKIVAALLNCSADGSLFVSLQSVDCLIDIFSADELHPLFQEMKIMSALRSALKRHKSVQGDKLCMVDPALLANTVENCSAFLEYKKAFA